MSDAQITRKEIAESEERLRRMYRDVFGTETGKKVLFSILEDLGFFTEATSPDRVALRNFGTFLVRKRIGLDDATGMHELIRTMLTYGK